jgi:hypothetical protein
MPLLQLRVLRFGFLEDGDVGVGIFPEGQKVSLRRPQASEHTDVARIRDIRIMRSPRAGGRPLLRLETRIHSTERETRRQAAANRLLEIK